MSRDVTTHEALWARMRQATPARIGLPRSGASIATSEHLAFRLAHAKARDAVHEALDVEALLATLGETGPATLRLHSQARDRAEYLLRPDLGRLLDDASRHDLERSRIEPSDICFVVADGLSPRAIQTNAPPLLALARTAFQAAGWRIGPISIVEQGRVAIGDPIGAACRTAIVAVLVGERPGLSAADSMGIYLTWAPRPGRSDAERNCLSNIRPGGLSCAEAVDTLVRLCRAAQALRKTGVELKDQTALAP